MSTSRVFVAILGVLELVVDGVPTAVARPQVRKVLALLAAHAGEPVSTDALVEHLWPTDLPKDPRATLRVNLSRLRTVLGDAQDCLVSEGDAHRLNADVDLHRLEAAVVQARNSDDPASIIQLLSDAVALWRGSPFAGIDETPALVGVRSRSEETRWNAAAMLGQAYLDQRQHGAAIELLAPLAAIDPHRERLAIVLARALALHGRKSDALAVLEQSRAALRSDYGLSVSPALGALEQEILEGSVDLTKGAARPSPHFERGFLGRVSERSRLVDLDTGTIIVIGEPGIGKTALVDRAMQDRVEGGERVIKIAASDTPERPMELASLLVSALLAASDQTSDELQLLAPNIRAALLRVLPSLDVSNEGFTGALPRDAFVEALAEFVSTSADAGDVLAIDDLQWADPISADVIRRVCLASTSPVVLASRPVVESPTSAISQLLQADDLDLQIVELGPLRSAEIAAIVASRTSTPATEELAHRLAQQTGGNPLFLTLLLDVLVEGGQFEGDLPPSVLVAIQRRLAALSLAGRESLQLASVFGRTFSIPLASRLRPSIANDLDEAIRAGLVEPDNADGFGHFVHALVADGIYQMLPEGHRAALHDQVCEAMQADASSPLALVEHADSAAQIDPHRAIAAHLAAATELEDAFAWQRIVDYCQRARVVVARYEIVDPPWMADLALAEGRALRALEDPRARSCLVEATDHARKREDHEVFAQATLELCSHGPAAFHSEVEAEDYSALLEEALTQDIPHLLRAQLQAAGGTYFSLSTSHWRTRELFTKAFNVAMETDDFATKAGVLIHTRRGFSHPADFEKRMDAIDELRTIAGEDVSLQYECALIDFTNAQVLADRPRLDEAMGRILDLEPKYSRDSTRYVQGYPQFERAYFESAYALANGDLDEADRLMMGLFEIPDRGNISFMSSSLGMNVFGALLFSIRAEQDRLPELKELVDTMVAGEPDITTWRGPSAAIAAAVGDHDQAREDLEIIFADDFQAMPPDVSWSGAMKICAEPVAMLGDVDKAQRLYEALYPYRGRMAWNGMCHMGPIDHALAVTAEVFGDHDQAATHRVAATALALGFLPA